MTFQKIKIEKLIYGGSGVGFLDKLPVFVPMSVPGDELEIKIDKKHKGYFEGSIIHILKPSPNRVVPKCEHFGRCGGCQWQHIDYAAQILWKQLILEEQLVRIGKLKEPNVLPTIPAPKIWNYRSRIKLQKDGKGKTGFYAAGTHELIEVKDCLLADLKSGASSPEFFTQVNPSQNENLKEVVADLAKECRAKKVLELYCGNGNLTLPVSKVVEEITASDSDDKAICSAVKDVEEKGLKHIYFVHRSAVQEVKYQIKHKNRFDLLIVDPPRDGCKDIVAEISEIAPQNIIYVSCNPSTLARDLNFLCGKGYKLISSQPIDMFPQTYHIESVSFLAL